MPLGRSISTDTIRWLCLVLRGTTSVSRSTALSGCELLASSPPCIWLDRGGLTGETKVSCVAWEEVKGAPRMLWPWLERGEPEPAFTLVLARRMRFGAVSRVRASEPWTSREFSCPGRLSVKLRASTVLLCAEVLSPAAVFANKATLSPALSRAGNNVRLMCADDGVPAGWARLSPSACLAAAIRLGGIAIAGSEAARPGGITVC